MCSQFTVRLSSADRNTIIDIDRTIKSELIKRAQSLNTIENEWYFEFGFYIIRSYKFISKYYSTDYNSFFKERIIVPKESLLMYLNVARDYVDVHIIQNSITSWCDCQSPSMEESDNDTYCSNCGRVYDYISPNNSSTSNRSSSGQIVNLNKSIKEIEGNDPVDIEIEDIIRKEMKKRKISINNIKHETIFLILKDIQLNKYYKSINSIYNKITNSEPIILDNEVKKLIIEDYNKFESIYPRIKDSSRINSINMKFVLYKLLERYDISCKGYSVLRTEIKYQEHEQLWEEGCKLLSWKY